MTQAIKKVKVLRKVEPGEGTLEILRLNTDEEFLWGLFRDLFQNWWQQIQIGTLIQGGVQEIKLPCAPKKVARLDGYLTAEFGEYVHMHLCIGSTTGQGCIPTPPKAAQIRLPSRVELYRILDQKDAPTFWGLRTFNSRKPRAEQTLMIYLPNPLLTEDMNYADPPDWSKLALWDHLRSKYLGLPEADPKDRLAKRFTHTG